MSSKKANEKTFKFPFYLKRTHDFSHQPFMLKNKSLTAELTVILLWNETTNQTDSESCYLGMNNIMDDVVNLSGDPFQSCSVDDSIK